MAIGSAANARSVAGPFAGIRDEGNAVLTRGVVIAYLSLVVLIPLAAVIWRSTGVGVDGFWQAVTAPDALATLRWTFMASVTVVAINAVTGTCIAWLLVRDTFSGQALVNAVIDLPFALPTVVAGLTLVTLYGPQSPVGIHAAYTQAGVLLALLFVTLPFVVRAVQPVLLELDREMEEAAAALGAGRMTVFRRIILPALVPAILTGVALSFARAMGEFGAVVLISGGLPSTEVASMHIFSQIQSDDVIGAAAVSVVLLVVSFLALLGIAAVNRWSTRYAR